MGLDKNSATIHSVAHYAAPEHEGKSRNTNQELREAHNLWRPPEVVGLAQLLIGIPGLAFMLWGGVMGDRVDGRRILIQSHLLSVIPPLVLALGVYVDLLGFWLLIITARCDNEEPKTEEVHIDP